MRLEIFLDLRRILVHATGAKHALDLGPELATKGGEAGCNRGVIHLHIQILNDRLLGQTKGVRRIGPGNEGIRVAVLGALDNRRQIGRAKRIGFVIDNIITGFLEARTRRFGKLDTKRIGDVNHGNLVTNRAGGAHVIQNVDHRFGKGCRVAKGEKHIVIAVSQLGHLVRNRRHRNVWVVVFRIDRRSGKVEACTIGRDDEIDLVDFGQTLCRFDVLARIGLVVIFDDFNHHLLAANIKAATGIDLL